MKWIMALTLAFVMAGQTLADDFIVVVLDTSGSMDEEMDSVKNRPTRMKVAQDALVEVLSQLPSSTKVGLLTFDDWAYPLGKVDRQKLTQAIRSTRAGGGTPLYGYIRTGATRLLEERERQNNIGNYKLIVVTDGVANDDNLNQASAFRDGTVRPGVMEDIAKRNITVDAIGLDMQGDHPIKQVISNYGIGSYMAGEDPSSLKTSLRKATAEISLDGSDTGEDAFAVLQDLPDEFFVISIKGLSTFQNHPIGEKPKILVMSADGTTVVDTQEAPGNEPPPSGGMGIGGVMLLVFGGVVCVVVLVVVMGSMGRRY